MFSKQLLFQSLGWGIILWLIGYLLGIALFFVIPVSLIGWVIMPIGVLFTLWVLFKRVKNHHLGYFLFLAVIWTSIAILFDYFFLVKLFKPQDGYYELDVYLYYFLTFFLPVGYGIWMNKSNGGK